MSDIEDGEVLSSDNEDYVEASFSGEEDEQKTKKNKVQTVVDSNNNNNNHNHNNNNHKYQTNDNWNFHRKNTENRFSKHKSNKSPNSGDRKRHSNSKSDSRECKRFRKSTRSDSNEQDYCSPVKHEMISDNVNENDNQNNEPNNQKRKILCKYYASGECKNGSSCVFMHEDFPCKFFHDKTAVCRAGPDCKYSHAPLSEEMQLVMDSFILDGKEHKQPTAPAPNFNTTTTVLNRTKCLLPTPPANPQMDNMDQQEFSEPTPVFFENNPAGNFNPKYNNSNVHGYPINKSKFVPPNDFRPKPNNFPKFHEYRNNYPFPAEPENVPYFDHSINENYFPDFYHRPPISPPEINFNEPPPDFRPPPVTSSQSLSYNNIAPARFIVGNSNMNNTSKSNETQPDIAFQEALKKLADTVVSFEPTENTRENVAENLPNIQTENNQKQNFPKRFNNNNNNNNNNNTTTNNNKTSKQPNKFYNNKPKYEKRVYVPVEQPRQYYAPIKAEKVIPAPKKEKVTLNTPEQELISYDPIDSSGTFEPQQISYSPVNFDTAYYSSEKVSYSPVEVSNSFYDVVIKPEKVTYSPVESDKVQPISGDRDQSTFIDQSKRFYHPDKVSYSPVELDKVKKKEEKTELHTVRIAESTSIFNINENEMSESDKKYIEEMRSLINLDAQFENVIPWVATKLISTPKQPYILYSFKVDQVHENAALDPRLQGHPVLKLIESQNDPEDSSPVNSEDENDESNENNLPPNSPPSYLYNFKFKKEKVSEKILL